MTVYFSLVEGGAEDLLLGAMVESVEVGLG